ncbi:uncharacterized protein ACR2FA_002091 [Aphomia sociella]
MFYDSKLMNSPCLRNIWRAANDQSINLEDGNLPDICGWLDERITSDGNEPRGRLSLRTAAVLIDGAAKIYERRLKRLIEDIDNLENDMIRRKRLRCINEIDYNTDKSSDNQDETTGTSEETSAPSETSTSTSKKIGGKQNRRTQEPSRSTNSTNGELDGERLRNLSRNNKLADGSHRLKKRGVVMQTYSQHRYNNEDILMDEFDKNLPFGYVMIYNNARDRIPRKIIFSSFSKEIEKLI